MLHHEARPPHQVAAAPVVYVRVLTTITANNITYGKSLAQCEQSWPFMNILEKMHVCIMMEPELNIMEPCSKQPLPHVICRVVNQI